EKLDYGNVNEEVFFMCVPEVPAFINCLDDSFQSRISVSLKYEELDIKAREKLWSTFLELMNCNHNNINIKKLSKKHLNGREIKNAALNEEKNEPITTELLEKILNVSNNKISENIAEGNKRKSGINDQDNQPNLKKIK
ncbi:7510_t:CDS:2, partial [Gigaspora rosea]